jgi:modulator of FtsH protease
MSNAYNPEAWHELYVMLGGSLAALAGLLFVAISIQIGVIREAAHWRTRAFGNTFTLIGLLIEAALVLAPQGRIALGVELAILNLFLLFFVPVRAYANLSKLDEGMPRIRLLAGLGLWLLGALGGVSLIAEAGGGMYLVTAASLGLVWIVVLNAWSFITVPEAHGLDAS